MPPRARPQGEALQQRRIAGAGLDVYERGGGYETRQARSSTLVPEAGEHLVAAAVDLRRRISAEAGVPARQVER